MAEQPNVDHLQAELTRRRAQEQQYQMAERRLADCETAVERAEYQVQDAKDALAKAREKRDEAFRGLRDIVRGQGQQWLPQREE